MLTKTQNLKETQRYAERFIQKILKEKKPKARALVVALSGDLGSGKTSFTQGAAKALGIKERVVSPTFIIERIYHIHPPAGGPFSLFIHIDCYRFKNEKDLQALGWNDMIKNPGAIIFVEWAERIKKALPRDAVWVHLSYASEHTRHLKHA